MTKFLEFAVNNWILCSVFAGLLIALLLTERKRSGKTLSPQQTVLLLNRDKAVILDIRDKKETSKGTITGSRVIPFTALKDRASELKKFEGKTIVIVDKMGQHSGSALKLLKTQGFVNVVRMTGGIAEWQSSNLPLVHSGSGAASGGKSAGKSGDKQASSMQGKPGGKLSRKERRELAAGDSEAAPVETRALETDSVEGEAVKVDLVKKVDADSGQQAG